VLASQNNNTARGLDYLGESLAFYRGIGDRFFVSAILNWMGHLKTNLAEALPLYQQGLDISREVGALDVTAWVLNGIGFTKLAGGHSAEAENCFRESLAIQRTRGDWKGIVL